MAWLACKELGPNDLTDSHIYVISVRHLKRQERLEEIITTRLLPRGRMTGSSRLEYSAYLARMSQSEEQRRTQTFSESRR